VWSGGGCITRFASFVTGFTSFVTRFTCFITAALLDLLHVRLREALDKGQCECVLRELF
jgi:hypothetical protein